MEHDQSLREQNRRLKNGDYFLKTTPADFCGRGFFALPVLRIAVLSVKLKEIHYHRGRQQLTAIHAYGYIPLVIVASATRFTPMI